MYDRPRAVQHAMHVWNVGSFSAHQPASLGFVGILSGFDGAGAGVGPVGDGSYGGLGQSGPRHIGAGRRPSGSVWLIGSPATYVYIDGLPPFRPIGSP